ncbi:MAG: hypothetical protein COZ98_00770, partial [Candidatus Omnitrophica bacterium CG_4_8_14_3_um_filter_43_15]
MKVKRAKDMENLDKINSVFIPWEQRHKLLLRIIASVVVVAFIFTQTGVAQAFDRSRVKPEQVTKERTGFLGLEAFKENKKLELEELQQRRRAEQQRSVAPAVVQYGLDKSLYGSNQEEKIYGIFPERIMAQQSIVQEILRVQSLMGKDYMRYEDGMIVNFDPFSGLTTSILNERVTDDHGNVSFRDTFNMHYNDKRLLAEYTSRTTAPNGVVTEVHRYDIQYTADSVFYGSDETNANKLIVSYKEEIKVYGDAQGQATYTDEYLHNISGQIYDENGNLLEYVEEVTDEDGNLVEKRFVSYMQYDSEGNLISYYEKVTDANNAIIREGTVYVSDTNQDGFANDPSARIIIEVELIEGQLRVIEKVLDSSGNTLQTTTRIYQTDNFGNIAVGSEFTYEVKDAYGYVITSLNFTVTAIEVKGANKVITSTAVKAGYTGEPITYELKDEYTTAGELVNSSYKTNQILSDGTVRISEIVKEYSQNALIHSINVITYVYNDGSKLVITATQEVDEDHDNRLVGSQTTRDYYSKNGKLTNKEYTEVTKDYDDENNGILSYIKTTVTRTDYDANENPIGTPETDEYETYYDAQGRITSLIRTHVNNDGTWSTSTEQRLDYQGSYYTHSVKTTTNYSKNNVVLNEQVNEIVKVYEADRLISYVSTTITKDADNKITFKQIISQVRTYRPDTDYLETFESTTTNENYTNGVLLNSEIDYTRRDYNEQGQLSDYTYEHTNTDGSQNILTQHKEYLNGRLDYTTETRTYKNALRETTEREEYRVDYTYESADVEADLTGTTSIRKYYHGDSQQEYRRDVRTDIREYYTDGTLKNYTSVSTTEELNAQSSYVTTSENRVYRYYDVTGRQIKSVNINKNINGTWTANTVENTYETTGAEEGKLKQRISITQNFSASVVFDQNLEFDPDAAAYIDAPRVTDINQYQYDDSGKQIESVFIHINSDGSRTSQTTQTAYYPDDENIPEAVRGKIKNRVTINKSFSANNALLEETKDIVQYVYDLQGRITKNVNVYIDKNGNWTANTTITEYETRDIASKGQVTSRRTITQEFDLNSGGARFNEAEEFSPDDIASKGYHLLSQSQNVNIYEYDDEYGRLIKYVNLRINNDNTWSASTTENLYNIDDKLLQRVITNQEFTGGKPTDFSSYDPRQPPVGALLTNKNKSIYQYEYDAQWHISKYITININNDDSWTATTTENLYLDNKLIQRLTISQ